MTRKPNTVCHVCGKEFYRSPKVKAASKSGFCFCSHACFSKYQTVLCSCPLCGQAFKAGLNKKYCSKTCANKARKGIKYFTGQRKSKYSTYRSYRQALIKLRGEVCELCGYKEHPKILVVHHIIKRCDGGTNDLTNLQLICPNCHALLHYDKEE